MVEVEVWSRETKAGWIRGGPEPETGSERNEEDYYTSERLIIQALLCSLVCRGSLEGLGKISWKLIPLKEHFPHLRYLSLGVSLYHSRRIGNGRMKKDYILGSLQRQSRWVPLQWLSPCTGGLRARSEGRDMWKGPPLSNLNFFYHCFSPTVTAGTASVIRVSYWSRIVCLKISVCRSTSSTVVSVHVHV